MFDDINFGGDLLNIDFSQSPNLEEISFENCSIINVVNVTFGSKVKYVNFAKNKIYRYEQVKYLNDEAIELDLSSNNFNHLYGFDFTNANFKEINLINNPNMQDISNCLTSWPLQKQTDEIENKLLVNIDSA